jgi:hypothetical protein
MPLTDRPEFQAWLEERTANMVGRRHGDPHICTACGNDLTHHLDSTECLVCLAEQFGTETAERWLADAVAGFVRAAAEPPVFARMLADSIAHARDLAAIHAPPPSG